jgi:hypothetical protein
VKNSARTVFTETKLIASQMKLNLYTPFPISTEIEIGKTTVENKESIGFRNSIGYRLVKKTFFSLRSLRDTRLVKPMILKKVVWF